MAPNDRRCVSCRRVAPKSAFLRIVRLHPTHTVQLDQGMGRSAYLCPTAACLEAAQKRDRLSRMLKVKVPASIYEALWQRVQSPPAPVASTPARGDTPPIASPASLGSQAASSPAAKPGTSPACEQSAPQSRSPK
ncbi:YlxR family protein [Trichothermofontia sichuanensis]|uniref:YlxR family protein n=1 Tax=Trichothermofontia sichuanensis TaxID=3045816 RepID=UPI0028F45B31|nr:YlxR family protein [Trichothermofontia sichuanensis]